MCWPLNDILIINSGSDITLIPLQHLMRPSRLSNNLIPQSHRELCKEFITFQPVIYFERILSDLTVRTGVHITWSRKLPGSFFLE